MTIPCSSTDTTSESSTINATFKPSGSVIYLTAPVSPTFKAISSPLTLASFKLTLTATVVELKAYILSPTVIVTLAIPSFKAVTIPCSSTDTIPELSSANETFNPLGLVEYLIAPVSPTFKAISSPLTLASFKLTVTVTVLFSAGR